MGGNSKWTQLQIRHYLCEGVVVQRPYLPTLPLSCFTLPYLALSTLPYLCPTLFYLALHRLLYIACPTLGHAYLAMLLSKVH